MKRIALLFGLLFLMYYLSSIPGLKVVPVFKQVNYFLNSFDISLTRLAGWIAARLPEQLGPAKSAAGEFYRYALRNPETMEYLLRKTGHILLFFAITVALFLLLKKYFRSPWCALGTAVLLGTLIAVVDELHQTYVPGRVGSIIDVFIDFVGVTLAALLIIFSLLITGRGRKEA